MASTPPDLSTKLKAVNVLLAGIGEQPVTSLETVESSLAEQAEKALDEASRSLQVKEWYWNTENDYPLYPDNESEITLPVNTMRVSEVRHSGGDDLVERGRRLYNRTQHTYEFEQGTAVQVDLVLFLGWDELPEFAKQAIIYVALRRFQMRELTSTAIDRAVEEDMIQAQATLQQAEDAQGPANILTDTGGLGLYGKGARRR